MVVEKLRSTYTLQKVLTERRCGLKSFDRAMEKVGLQAILDKTLANYRLVTVDINLSWKQDWCTMEWAFVNAVYDCANHRSAFTINLDDFLDASTMSWLAKAGSITKPYERRTIWKGE